MKFITYALIFLSMFAFGLASYNIYLSITHPLKFKQEIVYNSERSSLDAAMVASIINVESSFNKQAKSNKNAIGLMQLKLETANYINKLNNKPSISETDLYKVEINLQIGTEYFKYLLNKFKNTDTAIAAYNAGETKVRSWLQDEEYSSDKTTLKYIPYKETRNYVKKVNKNYNYYKKLF